jgi:hypothetical protein
MTPFTVIPAPSIVIPAKAGIRTDLEAGTAAAWTPAFAGVTGGGCGEIRCAC